MLGITPEKPAAPTKRDTQLREINGRVYLVDMQTGEKTDMGASPRTSGTTSVTGTATGTVSKTGVTTGKPLTQAQQIKLNEEKALGLNAIDAAKRTADELEKLTDELVGNPAKNIKPHIGLKGITGANAYIASFPEYEIAGIKITSGNAQKAEQKLDTFKGKLTAFGRQLQSEYGKLGNMAVKEWDIIANSVGKLKPSSGNLDEQMRDIVRQARDFEQSLRTKYANQYGEEAAGKGTKENPIKLD